MNLLKKESKYEYGSDVVQIVAKAIRAYRIKHQITQKEFGKKFGIAASTVGKLEDAKQKTVFLQNIIKLNKAKIIKIKVIGIDNMNKKKKSNEYDYEFLDETINDDVYDFLDDDGEYEAVNYFSKDFLDEISKDDD